MSSVPVVSVSLSENIINNKKKIYVIYYITNAIPCYGKSFYTGIYNLYYNNCIESSSIFGKQIKIKICSLSTQHFKTNITTHPHYWKNHHSFHQLSAQHHLLL